jgi:N-methylhydantoinase A/oxoprolinase/acetone carboxylase beta subunit
MYTIGIDIGGTHTDGVIIDEAGQKVAWSKTPTTMPVTIGLQKLLSHLTKNVSTEKIGSVIMGTTHATNAILQTHGLLKVGLLRLSDALPQSPSVGFGWPIELKNEVIAGMEVVYGGYDYDGRPSSRFDRSQVQRGVEKLLKHKAQAISVVCSFATLNGAQELEVANLIAEIAGNDFPVTLSHHIGGIGFIERENATLLNSALKGVMVEGFGSMEQLLSECNIHAPLYMTQNNGSIVTMAEAIACPIKTIGAGLTNSFIGASKLAGINDAIVVDIGGTSTDIGVIESGYARASLHAATIGGISLHCALPDMLSLSLGGGSIVGEKCGGGWKVGPQSVAKELPKYSQVFGGSSLTLTDVGVAAGKLVIPGVNGSVSLSTAEARKILSQICEDIHRSIMRLKGKKGDVPVIVVGGAAPLLESLHAEYKLPGFIPADCGIANAYGAALAEVSGTIELITSLENREKVLQSLKEQAMIKACQKGADPKKVRIAQLSVLPLAYAPGSLAKVCVMASGPRQYPQCLNGGLSR